MINKLNRTGANTQPCLTPFEMSKGVEVSPSQSMEPDISSWKRRMRFINLLGQPSFERMIHSASLLTVSNAFVRSMKQAKRSICWVCMSPHTHFIAPPPPPPQRAQMIHLMKHTSNYSLKHACVLQNIHSSSAHERNKGLQFILSPARIHFQKTNITFLHDGKKGLQFIFSLQYPFIPSSSVA